MRAAIFRFLVLAAFTCSSVQAQDTQCLLPPRLTVGANAQVIDSVPNRVRSQPSLDGQPVSEIAPGTVIEVIEGPVCADGYNWWRVRTDSLLGWTAEGSDGVYWLSPQQPLSAVSEVADLPTPVTPRAEYAISPENASQLYMDQRLGRGWITDLAFVPSGESLLVGTTLDVRAVNIAANQAETVFLPTGANDIEVSPDGSLLAIAGRDGMIYVWDTATSELRHTLEMQAPAATIAFSQSGNVLASATGIRLEPFYEYSGLTSTQVASWDMNTGELLVDARSDTPINRPQIIFVSETEFYVVSDWYFIGVDGERSFRRRSGYNADVELSPNGQLFASITQEYGDAPTQSFLNISGVETDEYYSVDLATSRSFEEQVYFTPDSQFVLTTGAEAEIQVRRVGTSEVLATLSGNTEKLAFSPDGSMMALGDNQGTVRLFTTPTANAEGQVYSESIKALFGVTGEIAYLSFSPDGTHIAAADGAGEVLVWDVGTGENMLTLRSFSVPVSQFLYGPASSEQQTLFAQTQDASFRAWQQGAEGWSSLDWDSFSSEINESVRVAADVRRGNSDIDIRTVSLPPFNLVEQDIMQQLSIPSNRSLTNTLILEGQIITADRNGMLFTGTFGAVESQTTLPPLPEWNDDGDGLFVQGLTLSTDGRIAAAQYFSDRPENTIRPTEEMFLVVWDVAAAQPISQMSFPGTIGQMSLNFDGTILAAQVIGPVSDTLVLYNVRTWEALFVQDALAGIRQIGFTPAGDTLLTLGNDGIIQSWRVELR